MRAIKLLAALLGTTIVGAGAQEAAEEAVMSTDPRVRVVTNAGSFVIELDVDRAPLTVENFLTYVREGHYEDHRIPPRHPGFRSSDRRVHGRLSTEGGRADGRQ